MSDSQVVSPASPIGPSASLRSESPLRAQSVHEYVKRLDLEQGGEAAATFRFLCTQFGSDLGALYRPLPASDYLSEIGHIAAPKRLERLRDKSYWIGAHSAVAGIAVGVGRYAVRRTLGRTVREMMERTRHVGVTFRDFDSVAARRLVGDLWTSEDFGRGAFDAAERVLEAFELSAATSAAEIICDPKELRTSCLVLLSLIAEPMNETQLQAQIARHDLIDTIKDLCFQELITDDNTSIRDAYRAPFPHGVWALTSVGRTRIAELVRPHGGIV